MITVGATVTVKEVKEKLEYYTETLSAITRKLVFTAIVVAWTLKSGTNFDSYLTLAVFFAVIAAVLDIFHYIAGILASMLFWRRLDRLARLKKASIEEGESVDAPAYLLTLPTVFFVGKVLAIVPSYAFIGIAIATKLTCTIL